MKLVPALAWLAVSLVAAVSLGIAAGVLRTGEQVNALWLITAAGCCFILAYRFYAAFLAAKVLALDDRRITPALRLEDGVDFDPTNRWVLFGHHFAAIAGAGPLIGPMLAAQFGYLPGFLWILVGSVLAGAVHDMVLLAASVRRNGRSLAQIAADEIGPVAGLAASLAVIFIILVALAGLGLAVVNALKGNAWGTFTIACTIPIALVMGVWLRLRPGHVVAMSATGVVLLLAAVGLGHYIPGSGLGPWLSRPPEDLVWAIAIYGFVASVLPVWLLLCPRDYLSTYMKIGTVLVLAASVLLIAPDLRMPAVTRFAHGGGPIIPGTLFPFMFITIACGAISGFHSLIASGTTPKMIKAESDIPLIGYGAMLTEAFVGVTALVAATILAPGDYFAINSLLGPEALTALGFPPERLQELAALVQQDIAGRPGGAVSLAVGMASILGSLPGMKGLMPYWYNFALMFEALFILTTVDAGTRVARFLLQELAGRVWVPLGRHSWWPGILGASALVVGAWAYLIHYGSVSTIWPMFGIANQLLAAIALGVGTTILIKSGKLRYAWTTAAPMVFMFATTLTAAWMFAVATLAKIAAAPTAAAAFNAQLNVALVAAMAVLAVVVLADMLHKWIGYLRGTRPMTLSEVGLPDAPAPR